MLNVRSIRPALLTLACFCLSACAKPAGPSTFEVTGNVTFKGAPVPKGTVTFEPDSSRGNSGPGSVAMIENGRYKTEPGKGILGGPYLVRIVGTDGKPFKLGAMEMPDGQTLFPPYQKQLELSKSLSTQDFDVPAN